MLDPRVYRAGWLPFLLAVVVVAFALRGAPHGSTSSLSAQVFDGSAALARVDGWLADAALRDRRPGGAGDEAMARVMARELRRQGFSVSRARRTGRTAAGRRRLTAVLGRRVGISDRAVVVVADRSSLVVPGRAGLTASSALLELARVLGGRSLDRTLVLASVSGGPGGAGTAALAGEVAGPIDAVLVLGPLGGVSRQPWVVPYSAGASFAPYGLRQTVAAAVRQEVGRPSAAPGLLEQFGRLGFPLTLGGQGPLLDRGIPSVMLSAGGERSPGDGEPVSADRLERFGRAALRAVTALDTGSDVPSPGRYLVVAGKILPAWTVRLLTGTLLLPLLLAVVDGLARVRRRRGGLGRWLAWAIAGALPFVLAAAVAGVLGLVGLTGGAPPGAVGPGDVPLRGGAIVALVLVVLALVGGWLGLRGAIVHALGLERRPAAPGAAAGAAVLGLLATVGLWVTNPFAAALVIPALHIWLLVTAPETRPRRGAAVALALLGGLPAALGALGYALAFGLGPLALAWTGVLAVAGGAVAPLAALAWCAVLGAFGSVLAIASHTRPDTEPAARVTVRGPRSYAGPGSLGGTESALRR